MTRSTSSVSSASRASTRCRDGWGQRSPESASRMVRFGETGGRRTRGKLRMEQSKNDGLDRRGARLCWLYERSSLGQLLSRRAGPELDPAIGAIFRPAPAGGFICSAATSSRRCSCGSHRRPARMSAVEPMITIDQEAGVLAVEAHRSRAANANQIADKTTPPSFAATARSRPALADVRLQSRPLPVLDISFDDEADTPARTLLRP